VLSFVTSFYGNGGTKFPDKIQAVGKLAGSYEYTNTTGGNVLDGAISSCAGNAIAIWLVFFQTKVTVQLNMSEGKNGQLPLAKQTVRGRISADIWEQIKTAYASGIGLREIARNMGIPEGTVLARAKREGWTQQIQSIKALAKRDDTSTAVTPFQAASASMQQRGERHIERMAGVSQRAVDHIETMDGPEILNSVDHIEKLDKVARRTFGLNDNPLPSGFSLNVLNLGSLGVEIRKPDS
jgi:hypothetical protein